MDHVFILSVVAAHLRTDVLQKIVVSARDEYHVYPTMPLYIPLRQPSSEKEAIANIQPASRMLVQCCANVGFF